MSDARVPAKRRSWAGRFGVWLLVAAVAAVLLVFVVHVMIPPVSPAQDAPLGHFSGSCGLCHFVSEGVDVVPVQ